MDAFKARDAALASAQTFSESHVVTVPTQRVTYDASPRIRSRPLGRTEIVFDQRDTIDVAMNLRNPLLLILADADRPGGCVHAGAGMQEESLFRRTALFAYLDPQLYPIGAEEALYARDVPVLMESENRGYKPLTPNRHMAFIACPGLKMPATTPRDELGEADAEALRRKIRLIVQTAVANGHTELVAGALGCGAYGCPIAHVARLFAEVLLEMDGLLVQVNFAIMGASFDVFERAFLKRWRAD